MSYDRLQAILTVGLIVLLLTVCDDIEGVNQVGDGQADPVGTTAVLWAKPVWAAYVNGECPEGYTQLDADYCFKCPEDYVFSRFPDDDFCYYCPPGYSIGAWTDDRGGIHYSCYPP